MPSLRRIFHTACLGTDKCFATLPPSHEENPLGGAISNVCNMRSLRSLPYFLGGLLRGASSRPAKRFAVNLLRHLATVCSHIASSLAISRFSLPLAQSKIIVA